MRADARENHDRLLEIAARAFAREGTGASLKAIAREAGVGIGTVYRRFPTRETLVEAVYRQEVARLCAAAPLLLETAGGAEALRAWMEQFVDFMGAKRGLGETLRAVLTSDEEKQQTRDQLRAAIGVLLAAGVADGTVRASVDSNDLLLSLGGITLIAAEESRRELATRLIALLLGGVLT
jgi:AcrR family transcriptional regulator